MPSLSEEEHELELRHGPNQVEGQARDDFVESLQTRVEPEEEPMTLTAATEPFLMATSDTATQSADALCDLLHNLRAILHMDIAFIAEFVGDRKFYRVIDHGEEDSLPVKTGDSVPLDTTLCQRVVDGRLPRLLADASTEPLFTEPAAPKVLNIGAHLSTPAVSSDGSVYGTLCCISHTPR